MASELEDLKKLRDITGAGILDCKKYLVRASNNLDEAIKLMRSEEGIKADKKSSRVAAEGVVFYYSTDEVALLLEINSETDFVAKSDDFINYVEQTANMISGSTFVDYDQLMSSDNETLKNDLEEMRKNYVTKLGENIQIRRFKLFDKKDDIKRNIMEGKVKKFISENTLLNQPFIKDSSLTLNKIIKDNEILHYTRYELGEGIDKKKEDFAEEVYNQIK